MKNSFIYRACPSFTGRCSFPAIVHHKPISYGFLSANNLDSVGSRQYSLTWQKSVHNPFPNPTFGTYCGNLYSYHLHLVPCNLGHAEDHYFSLERSSLGILLSEIHLSSLVGNPQPSHCSNSIQWFLATYKEDARNRKMNQVQCMSSGREQMPTLLPVAQPTFPRECNPDHMTASPQAPKPALNSTHRL